MRHSGLSADYFNCGLEQNQQRKLDVKYLCSELKLFVFTRPRLKGSWLHYTAALKGLQSLLIFILDFLHQELLWEQLHCHTVQSPASSPLCHSESDRGSIDVCGLLCCCSVLLTLFVDTLRLLHTFSFTPISSTSIFTSSFNSIKYSKARMILQIIAIHDTTTYTIM